MYLMLDQIVSLVILDGKSPIFQAILFANIIKVFVVLEIKFVTAGNNISSYGRKTTLGTKLAL
jgi:hypothetical protein